MVSHSPSTLPTTLRNLIVAGVAIALTVVLFLGLRHQSGRPSLASLAVQTIPYDVAQGNGKASLVEFYADWCTTCQAMATTMDQLRHQYGDQINFVMLNVDNHKWLPEMVQYGVDGIPHFLYLDNSGELLASAIGEQPREILADNLMALQRGLPLPHQQTLAGQRSPTQGS